MTILKSNLWWMRRLIVVPLHIFFFSIVVFFVVRLIPGDPVRAISGGQTMTPEQYDSARESLGLTGSIFSQLTTFLGNVVTLDFGSSIITGAGVLEEMKVRLPATLELALVAMIISSVLTLAIGFFVVMRPRNPLARAVAGYSRAAGAVPDFCLGVAGIFVFYSVLHWAPAPIGRYDTMLNAAPRVTGLPFVDAMLSSDTILMGSMIKHMWLPIAVLVIAYAPMLSKLFIRSLEQAKDAQSTKFRIASGASPTMVRLSIARRALPSTVAMFGTIFGFMLGGAVIVEQLFAMPGMGEYAVQAVSRSDFVALQGFLIIVAAVSLFVFFFVDIVNMLLDPRRRPGATTEGS
ncbi:ABC transporter permease [Rhodococcoides yunnanense]|uniref:ABC transporter permease n=1 Tax=Rhodococcoides yunnanense TaxID=278209 RepID=UPI000932A377|nr:ABC transporter permease [Rhodococcus yunnanensis]